MNLLRTIAFISWQLVAKLGPVRGVRVIWRALLMALHGAVRPDRELYLPRVNACQRCRFYDAKHGTCGTPGETYEDMDGRTQTLGCWCIVRFANRSPNKACWARTHDLEEGWGDALMPKWWLDEQEQNK